jgi:CheY-like chemotaxis protein
LRRLLLRQLGQLGYRGEAVASAADALALLETQGPFDLLFTDIVMAGKVDGFDLARIVAERWPGIAIVTTSEFPSGDANGPAAPLPSVQLLGKPYLMDNLARALGAALDQRGAVDGSGR